MLRARRLKSAKAVALGLVLGTLAALLWDRWREPPEIAADSAPAPSASATGAGSPSHALLSTAAADAADGMDPADAATPKGLAAACSTDMVLVEGDFCPVALQRCTKHHPEWETKKNDPTVSERCLEYQTPSKCLSKQRRKLRFCIDRYEWPNEKGELPLVLVQWVEAKKQCEAIGKRLCDEEEWLFACEGEQMLPHVYGYVRDPTKCQIDRSYVRRERPLKRYGQCMNDPECKAAFDKLDQRKPAGSFPECVSPFGVYDLNGSINEWVNLPDAERPNRSGLKGGWWGPVRSRCRPTVKYHKEEDWGYEAGFRCCADAEGLGARASPPELDAGYATAPRDAPALWQPAPKATSGGARATSDAASARPPVFTPIEADASGSPDSAI